MAAYEAELERNGKLINHLVSLLFAVDQLKAELAKDDEWLLNPERIILNEPASVILWDDGTKTVSKAREGDEYDPLLGILCCIARKATDNRGHGVDYFEDNLRWYAENIHEPADIDDLLDDIMTEWAILYTLKESADLWLPQLGEPDEPEPEEDIHKRLHESVENIERTQDEIRQMVRNLTLDGEL